MCDLIACSEARRKERKEGRKEKSDRVLAFGGLGGAGLVARVSDSDPARYGRTGDGKSCRLNGRWLLVPSKRQKIYIRLTTIIFSFNFCVI